MKHGWALVGAGLLGLAVSYACSATVVGEADPCVPLLACCPKLPSAVGAGCQTTGLNGDPGGCASALLGYQSTGYCFTAEAGTYDSGANVQSSSCMMLQACCPTSSSPQNCASVAAANFEADCAALITAGSCANTPCPESTALSKSYTAAGTCGTVGTVTLSAAGGGSCALSVHESAGVGLPSAGAFTGVAGPNGYDFTGAGWQLGSVGAGLLCTAETGSNGAISVQCDSSCPADSGTCADAGVASCFVTLTPTGS